MSDQLAEVVRALLDQIPCSERALALEAGAAYANVSRIRTGERGSSQEVAASLADALRLWGERCEAAEEKLREALGAGDSNGHER